jgi:hypothetical protein
MRKDLPVPNPYRDRLLTVGVISRRSGDQIREGRRPDGVRVKATTDELGNTVTEHAKGDRQDVLLRPQTVDITPP